MAAFYNNFGRRLINKHTEWPSHQRKFDRNFKMAALVDCLERMNSQKSLKGPFISQILNSVFTSFFFILSISGEKKEEQAKINFVATVKDLMYIDQHRTLVHWQCDVLLVFRAASVCLDSCFVRLDQRSRGLRRSLFLDKSFKRKSRAPSCFVTWARLRCQWCCYATWGDVRIAVSGTFTRCFVNARLSQIFGVLASCCCGRCISTRKKGYLLKVSS